MSVNDVPTGDSASLAKQAEAVLQEAAALTNALRRARLTQRVLFLLVLVVVVLCCVPFYRLWSRLQSDAYLEQLRAAAGEQLEKNADDYLRDVQGLADEVRPVLLDAFSKQAKKDTPAYLQAMKGQSDLFAKNLLESLPAKLDEFHERSLERNRKLLENDFPAARDPVVQERLVDNFHVALDRLAKKYYVPQLQKEMDELYGLWDGIPPAPPAAKGDPPPEEAFIGSMLNLLTYRLTHAAAQP